jgi:hypothetical protein
MEKFIIKTQVSYQAIKDHSLKIPADKKLQNLFSRSRYKLIFHVNKKFINSNY